MKKFRLLLTLTVLAIAAALVGAQDNVEAVDHASVLVQTASHAELIAHDDETFVLRLTESVPVAGYITFGSVESRALALAEVAADLATAADLNGGFGVDAILDADGYRFELTLLSADFDVAVEAYNYTVLVNEVSEGGDVLKSVAAAPDEFDVVTFFMRFTASNLDALAQAEQLRLETIRGQRGPNCLWTC